SFDNCTEIRERDGIIPHLGLAECDELVDKAAEPKLFKVELTPEHASRVHSKSLQIDGERRKRLCDNCAAKAALPSPHNLTVRFMAITTRSLTTSQPARRHGPENQAHHAQEHPEQKTVSG